MIGVTDYPLTFEPIQGGQCAVRVVAPGLGLSWLLRIPEGLACNEGVFKTHEYPMVDWRGPDEAGTVRSMWESTGADFARIERYELSEEFGRHFVEGIGYEIQIERDEYGATLQFTATNTTLDRTWHNVIANPCLGRPTSFGFEDPELDRTYMTTGQGLMPLRDVDLGSGDPIRAHFDVAGLQPKKWFAEPFWGKPSATLSTDGTILRTSTNDRHTVGFGWTRTGGLFFNEDSHHCIHSVAMAGDLGPGESGTVYGKIVVLEAEVAEVHNRLVLGLDSLCDRDR